MKSINATAREVIAKDGDTSLLVDGSKRYNKELKIQQEKTKCILMVICSKVKSWVYKLVYILF